MPLCIAPARASLWIYDAQKMKWCSSGSSKGLSEPVIRHTLLRRAFSVLVWKLKDGKVVINLTIQKNQKYKKTTSTFHEWEDQKQKQSYGILFSTKDEADDFARKMVEARWVSYG
jgi:hypothetical protein